MRRPVHLRSRGFAASEAMTPMIDVVFLLLVFFVCASIGRTPDALLPAPLKGNSELLPDVPQDDIDPFERPLIRIRLDVMPDGTTEFRMNQSVVGDENELQQRLTQLAGLAPDSRVILDVQDDVAVQKFIAVYDVCQSLQLNDISFAVPVREPMQRQ